MTTASVSAPAREALGVLGAQIRQGRIRRGWTQAGLAERVGVSKRTIIDVERGAPSVSIGSVFEAAVLTGVTLYDADPSVRARHQALVAAQLALLPHAVREREVDDDF